MSLYEVSLQEFHQIAKTFYTLLYILDDNNWAILLRLIKYILNRDMWFPTMWYVRTAKAWTSLRVWAVWSAPWLVAWILYDC